MKKLIIPAIAIVLAFSASAFTTKSGSSNFYAYVGSDFTQANIQNINNYQASETTSCPGVDDVCGVTLATSKVDGSIPATTDFNSESTNLWLSEQANSAQDGHIAMQN